jgi:hypothetical protein
LSQAERWSLWFALASLDAAEGGDPARAAAGFARLHASLPADHPLVWPTVRGAIALPSAPADARALLTAMTQGVPRDDIPPDLLDRIDGGQ